MAKRRTGFDEKPPTKSWFEEQLENVPLEERDEFRRNYALEDLRKRVEFDGARFEDAFKAVVREYRIGLLTEDDARDYVELKRTTKDPRPMSERPAFLQHSGASDALPPTTGDH